jgi:flagellar biosynthesis/type III secretory pathway protein FliH
VGLLVLTPDRATAAWAKRPVAYSFHGSFAPLVLGPDQLPVVTDPGQALAAPELALLSVLAHGRGPHGRAVAGAAFEGAVALDVDLGRLYLDVIAGAVRPAVRAWLEAKAMLIKDYKARSRLVQILEGGAREEGRKEGREEGREAGLEEGRRNALREMLFSFLKGRSDPEAVRLRADAETASAAELQGWIAELIGARAAPKAEA